MEPGQFFKQISTSLLADQLLLQNAHNFLNGRSKNLVVTAEGRTIQLILLPSVDHAKICSAAPISAEDVLQDVISLWKTHQALLEVSDGNNRQFLGTKNAIESHKVSQADSSQNTYMEVSTAELEAFEKDALESVKVIKLDREPEIEKTQTVQTKATVSPLEEKSVTKQATRADLVFARMIGRVISRVIQAKEQEARKIDTQRRDETKKKEIKAEELQRHIVKQEINKQELRKETLKHESNKLQA